MRFAKVSTSSLAWPKQCEPSWLKRAFFGDWGKIGLVLGKEFVKARDHRWTKLADFQHDERETLNERITYEAVDLNTLTSLSYRRIYERVDA